MIMERLHRSRRNKVLLGVCGGLSEYLHIDVVIIRIVSILALLMGWGLIVYLVAALIMPEDKGYTPDSSQWGKEHSSGAYGSTYSDPGARTDNNDDFVRDFYNDADNWDRPAKYNSEKNRFVLGAILVGIGVMVLFKQFLPSLFQLKFLLPVFLVIIGGIILYQGKK
jgi:K+-transporting ATPase KdpF subunit